MKGLIGYVLGGLVAVSIVIVLLFTAVEVAAFMDMDFYRDQYAKNNVYQYVDIEEDQLIDVTEQLLAYTKGDREDLTVFATVEGSQVEFFNQREKDHMVDVRNLVVGAMTIRWFLAAFIIVAVFALVFFKYNARRVIGRSIVFGLPLMAFVSAALGIIISRDFEGAFIKFHQLLFTNDLWLLNPATDRLINIVPEPFFSAVALKIGITFGAMIAVVFIVSLISFTVKEKRQSISF